MGHILAAAGADFCFLDMEHSGFGIDTIKRVLTGYAAAGVPVFVRPPSKAYHHISRVLDAGADGVCLPMVDDAEQAAEIVSCTRYPPQGVRGIGLQITHDRFAYGDPAAKLAAANRRMCVAVQIETEAGAENVDVIAATPGVDMIWVGHYDLSAAMGIAGRYDHPRYQKVLKAIRAACDRHGVSLGTIAPDVDAGIGALKQGYNFISYATDAWLLRDALRAGIDSMRASLGKPGGKRG